MSRPISLTQPVRTRKHLSRGAFFTSNFHQKRAASYLFNKFYKFRRKSPFVFNGLNAEKTEMGPQKTEMGPQKTEMGPIATS
jgi:hypothetical protein